MQGLAALYSLLPKVMKQAYLHSATGGWLDLKAAEYSVFRREAQKTRGNVKIGRYDSSGTAFLPAGYVVKTEVDITGKELKYILLDDFSLEDGVAEGLALVEAELAGSQYNVPGGQIKQLSAFYPGIDYVINEADWITQEGVDREDDETLRSRAEAKWQQLSLGGNKVSYASLVQEITGVVSVRVNGQHPRGQGTIDIIITGTNGVPTQNLIVQVQEHVNKYKSLIADVLVTGAEPVAVNVEAIGYIEPDYGDEAVTQAMGEYIISEMFKYGVKKNDAIIRVHPDFGVDRSMIIANLRTIAHMVRVDLISPPEEPGITASQIHVLGTVNFTVQRAGQL
jgi:uncharacterized phage protein gp47/JayE